jgi:hydroxymethylglutaryl-CoA synthase
MVDMGLTELGLPRLARSLSIPMYQHACLGGFLALEGASRYCLTDGHDKLALVVASDIASYEKGTSGEVTSGAGAVAMLVERVPKLFEIDLYKTGQSSRYRGVDFRKPMLRHFAKDYNSYSEGSFKVKDWPVFSGAFSTVCYVDTVAAAVEDMLAKQHMTASEFYKRTHSILAHRPYKKMPSDAVAFLYARALARAHSDENKAQFQALCDAAKVTPAAVLAEINSDVDYFDELVKTGAVPVVNKATDAIAKALRKDKQFLAMLEAKMSLGSKQMNHFGNLYTGALPAWMACAFEEAAEGMTDKKHDDIAGTKWVCIGYGSGDASTAMPITPVSGWVDAARRIGVAKNLEGAVELTREQYEGIHAGKIKEDLAKDVRKQQFVVSHIGDKKDASFQDLGVEYYKFIR